MILLHLLKYFLIAKQESKLSKQQIQELQLRKFHKLVRFVSQKSPYYIEIIKKHHINIEHSKPEDFPILTKTEVIEHFDRIVTDPRITKEKISRFLEQSKNSNDLFLNRYYVIHTSGSSGVVGYYVYTKNEFLQGIANITLGNSLQLFQKFAFIGAVNGHFAGVTMANLAKRLPILYKDIQIIDINIPFTRIIDMLNKMKPTNISGYASALRKLAEAQQKGRLHIKPNVLQSGGEPLSNKDKAYIQNVFHAPVLNVYAASEHMIMGIGKDEFDGMYLMENNLYFEMKPIYTLVTNLYNFTLPLIRYQMSDRLQTITDTNKILPFTKVANIVGRNEYVPVFLTDNGNEDFISPLVFDDLFIEHVDKFQIHLISKEKFVLNVSLQPNVSKNDTQKTIHTIEQKMRAILDEKLMTYVRFDIQIVDKIWVDPKTGKFRLIVKE